MMQTVTFANNDLRLDYLDLYLIHWPVAIKPEIVFPTSPEHFLSLDERPLAATWSGMEACAQKELTRHIGVSNFSLRHLEEIRQSATIQPEMNKLGQLETGARYVHGEF